MMFPWISVGIATLITLVIDKGGVAYGAGGARLRGRAAAGWAFISGRTAFYVTTPVVIVRSATSPSSRRCSIQAHWRRGRRAERRGRRGRVGRTDGARGELEREKWTLLKAIKEAEFDLQMGAVEGRRRLDDPHVPRARDRGDREIERPMAARRAPRERTSAR
jgi:hypothetical protein